MLFLYRPRQTWMPYRVPRARTQQQAYNLQLQQQFAATRQVAPSVPDRSAPTPTPPRDPVEALAELARLRDAGALSDEEFSVAKAKLLDLRHDDA